MVSLRSMDKTVQKQVDAGLMLPLMEAFYTLQGEGYHKGSAAYFIRIGGCDVGCHWCDVKESWEAEKHPPTNIKTIVTEAKKYSDTIVITGGEPLMWNMEPLTTALKEAGLNIHIETSGAYSLTGHWDWFCLSPKKNKLPLTGAYEAADELKIIIYNILCNLCLLCFWFWCCSFWFNFGFLFCFTKPTPFVYIFKRMNCHIHVAVRTSDNFF